MEDQELLEFVDDTPPTGAACRAPAWRILVVDDDADVHESTTFGLRGIEIAERPLELLHAYSGAEALDVLARESDIAVVLLDVVMETEHAGLDAVERIRGELGLTQLRIVLRTGQPGRAPEIETIQRYDINDYKTKGELTRANLYVTLTAAVRSYDQLRRLEASRRGLEKIVMASHQFMAEQGLAAFAEGVITQIAGLLGIAPQGLVCASTRPVSGETQEPQATEYMVVAAAGPYAGMIDRTLADLDDPHIADSLRRALCEQRTLLEPCSATLFFAGRQGHDFAAYVRAATPLREVDQQLLEVFCTNMALCAANMDLLASLRRNAYTDRMLGLPNRAALIERMDQDLALARSAAGVLALLDIDQFAETNDMFGHVYGDRLLAAIAHRLTDGLPPSCLLARVAGDTFGVWGPGHAVDPVPLAALLAQPFEIEGVERPVSMSIGLVRHEAGVHDAQELYKNGSIALKHAKEAGRGRALYYTAEVGVSTRERTRLLHGLQRAFGEDRLFVVYQPQLALDGERVTGLEALLRWRTEDGKFISPAQFIPVAEQSGLIVPIGAWVLRTALRALARLRAQGHRLRMAVNVSSLQFAQPQFLDQVDAALATTGMPPEGLELEITESVSVMGLERVADLLRRIKARGIAVAIDDFGTGFSSLSYLDRLPADRLKIDRAFISALDSGRAGARIVDMIVPLGRRLGMQVLAEGVETASQAAMLRQLGCDEVQGYLYARPMPLDELERWLAGRSVA